jgi:hypothetical protein
MQKHRPGSALHGEQTRAAPIDIEVDAPPSARADPLGKSAVVALAHSFAVDDFDVLVID